MGLAANREACYLRARRDRSRVCAPRWEMAMRQIVGMLLLSATLPTLPQPALAQMVPAGRTFIRGVGW